MQGPRCLQPAAGSRPPAPECDTRLPGFLGSRGTSPSPPSSFKRSLTQVSRDRALDRSLGSGSGPVVAGVGGAGPVLLSHQAEGSLL